MVTRVTDGARWERHEKIFFFTDCRPRFARALPLINLKKKRDCSQSSLCIKEKITYKAIDMKMNFHSHTYKTHFHKKGFALSLVLKVRDFGTRKWPIRWSFDVEMFLHFYFLLILFKIQTSQLDIFAISK